MGFDTRILLQDCKTYGLRLIVFSVVTNTMYNNKELCRIS